MNNLLVRVIMLTTSGLFFFRGLGWGRDFSDAFVVQGARIQSREDGNFDQTLRSHMLVKGDRICIVYRRAQISTAGIQDGDEFEKITIELDSREIGADGRIDVKKLKIRYLAGPVVNGHDMDLLITAKALQGFARLRKDGRDSIELEVSLEFEPEYHSDLRKSNSRSKISFYWRGNVECLDLNDLDPWLGKRTDDSQATLWTSENYFCGRVQKGRHKVREFKLKLPEIQKQSAPIPEPQ